MPDRNKTTTGFVLSQMNANETGEWTIVMIKLLGDLTTKQDEKDIMTVVSKEAVTMLEVEDNKVSDGDINYTTNLGNEAEIEKRISTNENNSEQLPDSPKDHLKSDKVMINVKQESVVENYEALKEENNDTLSAIVDRIDNNEDITIDEMLIAIEKICAS